MKGLTLPISERRRKFHIIKTIPIEAAVHAGSQFAYEPDEVPLVRRLVLVTPGPALEPSGAGVCLGDSGGPLFGPGQRAIVGVASSYTIPTGFVISSVSYRNTRPLRASLVWRLGAASAPP